MVGDVSLGKELLSMCEKNPSEFSERDPEHGHKFYDAFQHLLLKLQSQDPHQLQQQPQQLPPNHQQTHQQLHYTQHQNVSTISDAALTHLGIHSMSSSAVP